MKKNQGQVLLLVVVAVAAVVTLVLSVVSRSVIDVRTTSNQEDSVRAFSAAESGVEKALLTGTGQGYITAGSGGLNNATATYKIENYAEGASAFIHPKEPLSGENATVWLMSHDTSGNLTCAGGLPCYTAQQIKVCWGNSGTASNQATTPALEAAVLFDPTLGSLDDVEMARVAYDPWAGRSPANSFEAADLAGCDIDGTHFAFSKTIDFSTLGIGNYSSAGALKFIKLRLLYNTSTAQQIGVMALGGGILPGQGKQVESTGVSGDSTRKVVVYSLFPDLPTVFDSVVYSSGGITK